MTLTLEQVQEWLFTDGLRVLLTIVMAVSPCGRCAASSTASSRR